MKDKNTQNTEPLFENEELIKTVFSEDIEEIPEPQAELQEEAQEETQEEAQEDIQEQAPIEPQYAEIPLESFSEPREDSRFIKFLKYLFPYKGDPIKEIIRKLVFLLALIVFITAGTYLIGYYSQGRVNEGMLKEARAIYDIEDDSKNTKGVFNRFDALIEQNDDVCGWLTIEDTKIDYPVYQAEDNDYYIDHDMHKQDSRYGAVFADCNATITKKEKSRNLVLYGHNMIDGSMFSQLLEYKDIDFYREHPFISFDTLYDENQYKVMAVFIINAHPEQDEGYAFNYRKYDFASEDSFFRFAAEVQARSIIKTDVDVKAGDELLTLSTCSYEFDDARTVVVARKLREGESLHTSVDSARRNKNPLYPQAYYDRFGGTKPDIDLSFQEEVLAMKEASGEAYDEAVLGSTELPAYVTSDSSNNLHIIYPDTVLPYYSGDEDAVYLEEDVISNETIEELTGLKTVYVDNYVGLSLSAAIEKINEDLLYIESIEYDGSDAPTNSVLEQSLSAGSAVTEGSSVTLTVSGTPIKVTVPEFIGLSLKKAKEKAAKAGLSVSTITLKSSKKTNTVLMQSVAPKTVTEDRSIVLFISNGINKLPNVIGMQKKEAKKLLEEEGFKAKFKYIETVNKKQIGKVCSQSVQPFEYVKVGTEITLYVAKKSTSSAIEDEPYKESEASPDKDSSKESSSKDTSSKDTSSKDTASKDTSSKNTSSKDTSSKVTSSGASVSSATTSTASSAASSTTSTVSSAASSTASSDATSSEAVSSEATSSDTTSSEIGIGA